MPAHRPDLDLAVVLGSLSRNLPARPIAPGATTGTMSSRSNNSRTSTTANLQVQPANQPQPRRILNIGLSTPESSNTYQFITMPLDCPVGDLFVFARNRMERRLDKRQISAITLRFKDQIDDTLFLVEQDDGCTWKNFVERAAQVDGDKIEVLAVVQL